MDSPSPYTIDPPWDGYVGLCWGLSAFLLTAMACYALFMSWKWRGRNHTTEAFVTARRSVPTWRIAWSFFAGSVGSWVISAPSSYASAAGLVGLFSYSFSSGLPVIMIAFAGPLIERSMPRALSLSEFIGWRYGVVAQIGITLLTILNMAIFMLAEYVTIGTLFKVFVGSIAYPIVITVGLLTLLYTTVGGLLVSIATDQVQGIVSCLMMLVVAIYLGVTFNQPLPPMDDRVSGNTELGLASIFTMPVSLFTSAVFTESLWQRAFAAEDKTKLHVGAMIGATATILVVFVSGLCGWLAAWADPATVFAANPNLYMFYGLEGSINLSTGTVNNWMGVLVLLMAVVMNEGTVDSLQNGLLASFSSFTNLGIWRYRRKNPGKLPADYQLPLFYTRILVVAINIPLIVLGTIGATNDWAILDLFVISNMLTCTIAVPVMFGLSSRMRPYFGGLSFAFAWIVAFLSPSLYAIFKDCWQSDLIFDTANFIWVCVPNGTGQGSAGEAMAFAWYRNGYRWQYFLLAIGTSLGATLLATTFNALVDRFGFTFRLLPGFTPLYVEDDYDDHESLHDDGEGLQDLGAEAHFLQCIPAGGLPTYPMLADGEIDGTRVDVTPVDGPSKSLAYESLNGSLYPPLESYYPSL